MGCIRLEILRARGIMGAYRYARDNISTGGRAGDGVGAAGSFREGRAVDVAVALPFRDSAYGVPGVSVDHSGFSGDAGEDGAGGGEPLPAQGLRRHPGHVRA